MDRLAELQHHVVRDVDDERNRADAREIQSRDHPGRSGAPGVDAAHHSRDEHGGTDPATDGSAVVDNDVKPGAFLRRDGVGGVAEGCPGGVSVFAGDSANGEGVATIGSDVDLDGPIVEAEESRGIRSHLGVETQRGETEDAVVLLPETELAGRGDHAVGDMSIRLTGGDGERAGQDRAGKRDDDLVSDNEVVGATDDAARLWLADIHLAPVDRLAIGLRLWGELEHPTDDDRTAEAEAVNRLFLEADAHERGMHVFRGDVEGNVDELPKP